MYLQGLRLMVRAHLSLFDVLNPDFVAELGEEFRIVAPIIVRCLKDSSDWVRSSALDGLSCIAAHGTCPSSPL